MRRRIKVMSLIWSMGDGGAQQVLINYLRDFQNDPDIDFRLYVFTKPTGSKYDREIAEKGYPVIYLNDPKTRIQIKYIRKFFQRCLTYKSWRKAIHDFSPDIVHVHISKLLESVLSAIRKENVPVCFDTLHSSPYRYTGRQKRIISNAFQNQNVIPICVTKEQVRDAKAWYGITRHEIVHNGVDIGRIEKSCCTGRDARKRYSLDENAWIVLGVGRLHPIKRYDLLIDAFAQLHKKNPHSILIFAGNGEEKDKLIRRAEALGVAQSVRFLGNIADVTQLYCAADVLAVTSESESSSLAALEAQICGLRCVLSDGVPEESVLLPNTRRMRRDATIEEWADALLNDTYSGIPAARKEDYEVHAMSRKMKEIYLKYSAMNLRQRNGNS